MSELLLSTSRRGLRGILRVIRSLAVLAVIGIVVAGIATTVVVLRSGVDELVTPSTPLVVNDVTKLNPVRVAELITPHSLDEIQQALASTQGRVSIGGGRYSQGGQTAYPDSLHIDMRQFNKVLALDTEAKQVTVQPGITWRQLQSEIDPHNLSIKIMQTYANFTVGGSLSVNVHGRYIGEGPVVGSVLALKLVLADGSLIQASANENADIFYGAIGGYGGLGVIVEASLQLEDNLPVERRVRTMPITDYATYFRNTIRDNRDVVFHNADIYPPNFTAMRDVSWYASDKPVTEANRLIPEGQSYKLEVAIEKFVAGSDFGKWSRQYVIDPLLYYPSKVVWRNYEASYDVAELEPKDRSEYTYGLREYFVPVERFDEFVPKMRDIFQRNQANIINVSVRHAKADPHTLLSWARSEVFAFVVYYRQGTDTEAKQAVKTWSGEMIDAVAEVGGAYYLPYQLQASKTQFAAAYPRSQAYFALKNRLDPNNRFVNLLWAKYYPLNNDLLAHTRADIDNYYRPVEQTLLTIPEWYLVFQPKEYADYLRDGGDPSRFPFLASIDEYWTLYDRVTALSAENYPANTEYRTMLRVIGISTTLEYLVKGAYEASLGRLSRWLAGGHDTPEDVLIQQAHRAYSDLIFNEPWYEFDFSGWRDRIWTETPLWGEHFFRKWERKLFFSAEFGVKSLYAKLIKYAAQSSYGETDKRIYLTAQRVHSNSIRLAKEPDGAEIVATGGDDYIMSVPRWGGFTEIMPKFLKTEWSISDISGNHQIAVSLLAGQDADVSKLKAQALFRSRVVSDDSQQRVIMMAGVADLSQLILDIERQGFELEHIFDY
ncbi:Decaprenylphosphoryl-beta-D-ribose oxidase [Zhongshania aliphaticivorans]|uniref:Decaprenylphosphoryl-beta-D-ribose oxidase n=1 Tax=Zhongshania aliphaticivorans TaxID=1470434 RepID=A0A5S9MQ12_9GAMM|nr:FAD-binding oxidoreductase [Zhongshania aliphaticivorans]CAA0079101.1 Decaprenylphosphoryl-beta-D-ribose oxidase [Zhongshania aliphaticivorans]CAA0086288.1 Decaprenylphosphoryl-beta-D-ribose oxidase [Zhongshania aliphaticivorans]